MSQSKSRRDGVFGSASVRHLPRTMSSNQEQLSKFSAARFLIICNRVRNTALICMIITQYVLQLIALCQNLREYNGDPLDWPEWIGMFLSTVDRSTTSDEKK